LVLAAGFGAFVLGMLLGVIYFEQLHQWMHQFFEQIQRKVGPVEHGPELFVRIFVNNALASLVLILSGLLFGVYPVYGLLLNGMAIGYLLQSLAVAGQSPWKMFLLGILPHGIFEIPAILLAAAFGMRLGLLVWQSFLRLLRPAARRKPQQLTWRGLFAQLPLTINLVLGLLLLAAAIESTVSLYLVTQYVPLAPAGEDGAM